MPARRQGEPRGARATAVADEQAARLVDACIALMEETGDLDPPVAAILRRAGLPTKAMYRLFPSKDDLLLRVWEHVVAITVADIEARMATASTPLERVFAWVWALADKMSSAAGPVPLPISSATFAARLRHEPTYPHPALVAPLEAALAALATESTSGPAVGTPAETARAVFDLVVHGVIRALVRGEHLGAEERRVLETSVRRVVGAADA